MSDSQDKFKNSKRRHKDESAINRQVKIAKEYNYPIRDNGRYAKMHATNCGKPTCAMCGNPRKFFSELTVQEQQSIQAESPVRNKRNNGNISNEKDFL